MPQDPPLQFHNYAANPLIDVAIHREPKQGDMDQHGHSFVELVYITGGKAIHETGGLRHPVKRGDVLIIHGNRTHAYLGTNRLSIVNVLVRERFIEACGKELGSMPGFHALFGLQPFQAQHGRYAQRLELPSKSLQKALNWIANIENLTHGGSAVHRFNAHAWLQLLLAQLVEVYGGTKEDIENPANGIALALAQLDASVKESITVAELAQMAGMSERTFLRQFREATGLSPIEFHIQNRVRHAERLLRETEFSVTEVAALSGFEDSNYFSRQFRRINGLTPSKWRNPHR